MIEYANSQYRRYLKSLGSNPEFLRRAASALDLLSAEEEQANGYDLSSERIAELSSLVQQKIEKQESVEGV